jgi:hypothetical protein
VATFNAASILEPLGYDFSSLAGEPNNIKELAGATGVTPEPTSLQVQAFFQASAREMRRLQREARKALADAEAAGESGKPVPEPTDAELAAQARAEEKRAEASRRRQATMVSKLCSGNPSAEILMKLPHRVSQAYGEWLVGEINDPEAVTGAGKPPLAIVRSPAAG